MERSRRQRLFGRLAAALAVVGGAAVITSAPNAAVVVGDDPAITACRDNPYSENATLRAGYSTTVSELMSWLDSRQPPDWGHVVMQYETGRAFDEPMSLCWIDGDFPLSGPPEASDGRHGKGRAAIVVDSSGQASALFFGYPGSADDPRFAPVRPTTTTTSAYVSSTPTTDARLSEGVVPLPSYASARIAPSQHFDALGVAVDHARCVSIGTRYRYPALWPAGTTARFAPLRIYDESGALIWTEGETRALVGEPRNGEVNALVPPECRRDGWAFLVSSVGAVR